MQTVVIVEVEDGGKGAEALRVGALVAGVGPLVEECLDEPLGRAVGLGTVRSGSPVASAEASQDLG